MKRCIALIPIFVVGLASAGQPLHEVLKLRTIEVLRCEAVTDQNVAEVSSFVRSPMHSNGVRSVPREVPDSIPGFLVEGIVMRQRDVTLQKRGDEHPVKDAHWTDAATTSPLNFFFPSKDPNACDAFMRQTRVHVVLSQRAECDTYPPSGLCVFDHVIRLVDADTWTKYRWQRSVGSESYGDVGSYRPETDLGMAALLPYRSLHQHRDVRSWM